MSSSAVPRLPASLTVEEVADALHESGAVIVEGLLEPSLLSTFSEEVRPYIERTPVGTSRFAGSYTTRTTRLFARTPSIAEIAILPLFAGVIERALEPNLGIQIGGAQVIRIMPGEKAQTVHRDDGAFSRRHPGPEATVAAMFALTPFTEENGATWVVPGSNRLDDDAPPPGREVAVQAVMDPGDALIWYGSTYHAGGANMSADAREGLLIQYSLGWIRQEENMYLSVPLERVLEYPEQVQRLLGYSLYGRFLGYIDWEVDPLVSLRTPGD